MSEPAKNLSTWPLLLSASAVLMITMGARQSSGLFVLPLNAATGLGIVSISFALAVGQLLWGAVQPFFGAMADRWGSYRVLVLGALLLAAGLALTPVAALRMVAAADHGGVKRGGRRGRQLFDSDRRDGASNCPRSAALLPQALSTRAALLASSFSPRCPRRLSGLSDGWRRCSPWPPQRCSRYPLAWPLRGEAAPGQPARVADFRGHARSKSFRPCAIRAICACMPASSPAGFMLPSWSPTCRVKSL